MKSKSLLSMLVIVVVLSSISLIVASKKTVLAQRTITMSLLTYENSTDGIKMQYPSSWHKIVNVTSPDIVVFLPPVMNSNASLTVSIDDISGEKMTLAQYVSGLNDFLKHQTQNFKLLGSTTNDTLVGLPAFKSMYTYAQDNIKVQGEQIGAIKGGKVYILGYEAGANEYEKYLPTVQQLIKSFQIFSSQPTKLL